MDMGEKNLYKYFISHFISQLIVPTILYVIYTKHHHNIFFSNSKIVLYNHFNLQKKTTQNKQTKVLRKYKKIYNTFCVLIYIFDSLKHVLLFF